MISDKKLEKLEKILGVDTVNDLKSAPKEDLDVSIIKSSQSIKEATEELEANPEFQRLKESLKAISEGLREVKKRQNAIIQYSLHLLEEAGKQ